MKIGKSMKVPTTPKPAETVELVSQSVEPEQVDTQEPEVEGIPFDMAVAPASGQVNLEVGEAISKESQKPTIKGSLLLRGALANSAVATEQTKAMLATSQNAFRFFCPVGGESRITFIDGGLDQDGALDIPYWYEHRLMVGRMTEVTCYETSQELGPCPVCLAGHRTQLVGGLTIINHTPHTIKSGQNAGKVLKNRKQMFVAPRTALETLQKLAAKRGGLAGHCFDVYRKENKDPRVGAVFDYVGELTEAQITSLGEDWAPYDWDAEITIMAPEEMGKLGQMAVPYGGAPNQQTQATGGAAKLNEIEI